MEVNDLISQAKFSKFSYNISLQASIFLSLINMYEHLMFVLKKEQTFILMSDKMCMLVD